MVGFQVCARASLASNDIQEYHDTDIYIERALVSTHNARWRALMVFLMGFFGQMSGNGLGKIQMKSTTCLPTEHLTGYFTVRHHHANYPFRHVY